MNCLRRLQAPSTLVWNQSCPSLRLAACQGYEPSLPTQIYYQELGYPIAGSVEMRGTAQRGCYGHSNIGEAIWKWPTADLAVITTPEKKRQAVHHFPLCEWDVRPKLHTPYKYQTIYHTILAFLQKLFWVWSNIFFIVLWDSRSFLYLGLWTRYKGDWWWPRMTLFSSSFIEKIVN